MKTYRARYLYFLIVILITLYGCNLPADQSQPGVAPPKTTGGGDGFGPDIGSVNSVTEAVFYNGKTCGPTTALIEVQAVDADPGMKTVRIRYRMNTEQNGGSAGNWKQMEARQVGEHVFVTEINIEIEAAVLGGNLDGVLEYQVLALDLGEYQSIYPENQNEYNKIPFYNCEKNPQLVFALNGASTGDFTFNYVLPSTQTVFYDSCKNGEPTIINMQVSVEPIANIASVTVHADFNAFNGSSASGLYPMSSIGINDYVADIDVDADGTGVFGLTNGYVDMYVFVEGKDGSTATSGIYSVAAYSCAANATLGQPGQSGQSAQPTQAGSAVSNNPPSGNTIPYLISFGATNPVYYGSCQSGQPTSAAVMASIANVENVNTPSISYTYQPGNVTKSQQLSYDFISGNYKATIPVSQQAASFGNGQSLSLTIHLDAQDKFGNSITSDVSVPVIYCGGGVVSNNPPQGNSNPSSSNSNSPQILFFLAGSGEAYKGQYITLTWETTNANCGVALNGWGGYKQSDSDSIQVPSDYSGSSVQYTLTAKGGDCLNPTLVDKTVSIPVAFPIATYGNTEMDAIWVNLDDPMQNFKSPEITFYPSSDTFEIRAPAKAFAYGSGAPPNFEACTGGSSGNFDPNAADYWCFTTAEGNLGYFQVSNHYYDLNINGYRLIITVFVQLRN